MTNRHLTPRTAKSARRKFSLTLLGVLALIAATSIAVFAVPNKPGFDLTASPSTQTVSPGQTATYSISLKRDNKFTSPVALSVAGLPANTSATFHPTPIPGSSSASSLTVQTNVGGTTPDGTSQLTITGTANGKTDSANVTLRVLTAAAPNFGLSPRPTERTITDGDSAEFIIDIARSGGFSGPVAFTVSGLPMKTSAQFDPNPVPGAGNSTTLVVTTEDKAKSGTYPLTLTGLGQLGPTSATRSTSVTLVIEEKKPFSIVGDPAEALFPGAEAPIDLALGNPHNFEIYVNQIAVAVDPHTSAPGCDAEVNFGVEQIPAGRYPITLPARSTHTLSELGFAEADMPAAKMHNLPVDQEACKTVQLHLQYSGTATK